jgi:hypothetical protein
MPLRLNGSFVSVWPPQPRCMCKCTVARSDCPPLAQIDATNEELEPFVSSRQLIMHILVQSRRSSCGAPNINAKRLAVSFFECSGLC